MMIQDRLRFSAWPIARRSRSPKSEAAGTTLVTAAGFAAGAAIPAFSTGAALLERQNGIRIAHSYGRLRLHGTARLHSIKVAARLIRRHSGARPSREPGIQTCGSSSGFRVRRDG